MVLKTKDPRLSRKLGVAEFVIAFGIFRDIVCSVCPGRRVELYLYLHKVVDLVHKHVHFPRLSSVFGGGVHFGTIPGGDMLEQY